MPRETIRRLSLDVERVLVAGAHLAAADGQLAKDKQSLEALAQQLGDKAPVIGQLAQAAARAVAASGKDAARELVSLSTMAAQVRSAQAQPAPVPAGSLEPLAPRPMIGTPCNAKDLDDIHAALVERGKGRQEKVREFIERGDIADLRLVDALIYAMGDSWIGEMVSTKAIPLLGEAIVAPIRASLSLSSERAVDGRRLRAVVAVQKAEARDLLEAALTGGTAVIREAALEAIADNVRGRPQLEPLVLDLVEKERTGDVKRAALRALAGYGSDRSLEALVAGLDDARTLSAACEALSSSTHPRAVERLLARLGEAVAAAKTWKKAGKDGKASAAGKGNKVDPKQLARSLLFALASHKHPSVAAAAMELVDDYGSPAAWAAVESADRAQLTRIADALEGDDTDMFGPAVAAALKLGGDEAFSRLTAAFDAKDRVSKAGEIRLRIIAGQLEGSLEPRWADFFIELVSSAPRPVAKHVIPLLGQLKDKRAVKPLIAILQTEKSSSIVAPAIRALGHIGDSAALDPILAFSSRDEWEIRYAIRQAVLELDDPAAVEKVRTLFVKIKDPNSFKAWHIRSLLQQLEVRFPGK